MAGAAKLTANQERLIAALLTEKTQLEAAQKVGISKATLYRWLAQPEFLAAYRDARRGLVETALGQLQGIAGKSVEALERNLTCKNPAVEVRAALGVLAQAVKAVELTDLVEQVEELRALIKGGDDVSPNDTAEPVANPGEGVGEAGPQSPGLAASGPGTDHASSGTAAGPVAGDDPDLDGTADIDPLFPPGR